LTPLKQFTDLFYRKKENFEYFKPLYQELEVLVARHVVFDVLRGRR